jgi:hypothetical protein
MGAGSMIVGGSSSVVSAAAGAASAAGGAARSVAVDAGRAASAITSRASGSAFGP